MKYKPEIPMTGIDDSGLKITIAWVANWVLNWQPDEMEELYQKMYPLRYAPKNLDKDDIQVSV